MIAWRWSWEMCDGVVINSHGFSCVNVAIDDIVCELCKSYFSRLMKLDDFEWVAVSFWQDEDLKKK